MTLPEIYRELSEALRPLAFGPPVSHVYHPLSYARAAHEAYLTRYGKVPKEVILLGMNPGPWGMAQTGVPFGEVAAVRDWLGIKNPVGRPEAEHPKRPVEGLACPRREVSGRRIWGWARDRFGAPEVFFRRFFVANYCPLLFLEAGGRNRTPDKLPRGEQRALFAACDRALRRLVETLRPRFVIGVGVFAESRARSALAEWSEKRSRGRGEGLDVRIGRILHPSPASPKANRGWAEAAERELAALGVPLQP